MKLPTAKPSVTAATLQQCTLRRLGVGKNRILAPVAEVHCKEMISVNPDLCIFPSEIPWNRGVWQAMVDGVAKSWTQLR